MRRTLAMIVLGMFVLMAVGGLFSSVVADVEQNDTFEKAEVITSQQQGQVLPGDLNLTKNDPADCYKFDPVPGSQVLLNCSVQPGDKTRFTLFDFNKVILNNSGFIAPDESWKRTYYIGQQVSTYYLMVDHDQAGAEGASVYQLQVAWPDQQDGDTGGDAGDDIANPKDVSGKLHFNGSVGDADSADFYSFQCNAGDEIHVTLAVTGGAGMGMLKLYDKDKVVMQASPAVPLGGEATIDASAGPGQGTYFIEVYSGEDHKGVGIQYHINLSTINVPPDTIAPTVHIDSPADGATLDKTTVIITGSAADDRELDYVQVAVNDGPWQKADGQGQWIQAMVLSVGQNSIVAMAVDKAQNNATHEITVNVTSAGDPNDTVVPTLVITEPANGATQVGGDVDVKGTASDNKGLLRVELRVGTAGPWMVVFGVDNWHMPVTLVNGANLISVRAVDASGNTATKQITVYRLQAPETDNMPPNIHITEPVGVATERASAVTVKGNANDDKAVLKVDVSLNGGPFMPATDTAPPAAPDWSNWSFDAVLVVGENMLKARAMDTAGNINNDTLVLILSNDLNDTTPPMILVLTPPAGTAVTNVSNMVISGTAADKSGIQRVDISQNDGPWMACTGTLTWTYPATLVNGLNTFKVRVIDKAANINTTTVTIAFNASADLLKPRLVVDSPSDNASVVSDKIDVKGTASDNVGVSKVELTLNGFKMAVIGTTAWKSRITLKEGKNTIIVTAYDAYGNMDSKTLTVTYKKPAPKPPIPGFEVGFLLAAVLVGVALLGRKRRA